MRLIILLIILIISISSYGNQKKNVPFDSLMVSESIHHRYFLLNENKTNYIHQRKDSLTNDLIIDSFQKKTMEGDTINIYMKKELKDISKNIFRGNLSDIEGNSISGAEVSVKGTSIKTVTDFEGNFEIIAYKGQKIKISRPGFSDQFIEIEDQKEIEAVLESTKNQKDINEGENNKTKRESTVFISVGKNFTYYDYSNTFGSNNPTVRSSGGINFELGKRGIIYFDFLMTKLMLSSSVSLNEYNAEGGNDNLSYKWETTYFGLNLFATAQTLNLIGGISFELSGGAGISHIVYGRQKLGSSTFNLISNNEFDGIFFKPFVEFGANFYNTNKVNASILINSSRDISLDSNSDQYLNFNNFQIKFRICIK